MVKCPLFSQAKPRGHLAETTNQAPKYLAPKVAYCSLTNVFTPFFITDPSHLNKGYLWIKLRFPTLKNMEIVHSGQISNLRKPDRLTFQACSQSPKLYSFLGVSKQQLPTDNLCVVNIPRVITNGPPLVIMVNFDAAFKMIFATHESYLDVRASFRSLLTTRYNTRSSWWVGNVIVICGMLEKLFLLKPLMFTNVLILWRCHGN